MGSPSDECLFQDRNKTGLLLCLMSTELVRVSGESTKYWTSALEKTKMIDFLNFRRQKPQNNQRFASSQYQSFYGFLVCNLGYIFTRSLFNHPMSTRFYAEDCFQVFEHPVEKGLWDTFNELQVLPWRYINNNSCYFLNQLGNKDGRF